MAAGDVVYCDRFTKNGIRRNVCVHIARRWENGEPRDLMLSVLRVTDHNEDQFINCFVSLDWRSNPHESGYTKLNAGNLWESDTGRFGRIGGISRKKLDEILLDIYESDMAWLLKLYTHPVNDQRGSLRGLASTGGW